MKKFQSNLLLVVTAMIWGFAFAAQRMGADHIQPFGFNGIRFMLGAISLVPVILIFENKEQEKQVHKEKLSTTLFAGVIAGLLLFTASALQQFGIVITQSAGKASFMTGLYTVMVPVFGIFLGRKTNINIWIGAVLAVVGMFFLCIVDEKWRVNWILSIGDIILFFNAVFWAFHIIVIDRFVSRIYSLRFAFTQFVFCGALSFVLALFMETLTLDMIKLAVIPILYCGLMSVGVAYTCQIIGQKHADPTYASIILSTESLFGSIGGVILLNETMTKQGYFGCALIFAGVIVSQIVFKKKVKTLA